MERDDRRLVEPDIPAGQIDQFLHPCSGIIKDSHEDKIPFSRFTGTVRLFQQYFHLICSQEWDHRFWPFLHGHRQDLLDFKQVFRSFLLHVSKKGMQGRQPLVPCGNGAFPLCFQPVEELDHGIFRYGFHADAFSPQLLFLFEEREKKLEGISIGRNRIRADIPLPGEVLSQEIGQVFGKIIYMTSSSCFSSSPGNDVAKSKLHLGYYLWIEIGSEPQIVFRAPKIRVPEIRRKVRQEVGQFLSVQYPFLEAVNAIGMSQVMDPRPASGMGDAGLPQVLPEPHVDCALVVAASVETGEIVGIKRT